MRSGLTRRIGAGLNALAHTHVHALGRAWPSFHFCGIVGWLAGISLALWLTSRGGLSLWVTGGLAVAAFLTFLGLTMAVKILIGHEQIVYYHHEIALVVVSSLLLWSWRQPLLPYLDRVFMGLGLFLACGRIGCLMVGCCHGRPHAWGIRYHPEHVEAGFSAPLVEVPLFPIQLVESLWVAATVVLGTALVLSGAPAGMALAWYSILYGAARFGFEFVRGDTRPYWGVFSEAQWTTLLLMWGTVAAELTGVLPLHGAHVVVTGALALAVAGIAVRERPFGRLLRGPHVQEVAELLSAAHAGMRGRGQIHLGETSLGLRLSASTVRRERAPLDLVAFSWARRALEDDDARRLAVLIARLQRHRGEGELLKGRSGVFHVLLSRDGGVHGL
jgi:hypothetical protein